jgi:hypothetical protein
VAAWELAKMSRELRKHHAKSGGLEQALLKVNDHQDIYHSVVDLSISGFLPRQFVMEYVWKWGADNQELTVVAESVAHEDFPEDGAYQRVASTIMVKYKQEEEVGGVPQTRVTWTQQLGLGGEISEWVVSQQAVKQLVYVFEHAPPSSPAPPANSSRNRFVSKMRARFDRSLELDGLRRETFIKMVRREARHRVEYSKVEEKILVDGRAWFKAFDTMKSKDVAMRSPQTKGQIAVKRGSSKALGWSSTIVRAR